MLSPSQELHVHFDHAHFIAELLLTLELRMSHFCDADGHPLSAAVAILQQSNEVALTARS